MKKLTEKQIRDKNSFWPKTKEELFKILDTVEEQDGYGETVEAIALFLDSAKNYLLCKAGGTGFQAGAIDIVFLRRTRNLKNFQLLNIEKLIYPQYCNEEHFPSFQTLMLKHKDFLKKRAIEKLNEKELVHKDLKAHWEFLANA